MSNFPWSDYASTYTECHYGLNFLSPTLSDTFTQGAKCFFLHLLKVPLSVHQTIAAFGLWATIYSYRPSLTRHTRPPLTITDLEFRLIDYNPTVPGSRLDTWNKTRMSMNIDFDTPFNGLMKNNNWDSCFIRPDQPWSKEGWTMCEGGMYMRIANMTGTQNYELDLEFLHLDLDNTTKYPDTRISVNSFKTKVSANTAGSYLACERKRHNKDVVCKMSWPGAVPGPIPLAGQRTTIPLEPLIIKNMTLGTAYSYTNQEERCNLTMHVAHGGKPFALPNTSSPGAINAIEAQTSDTECKASVHCGKSCQENSTPYDFKCTNGYTGTIVYGPNGWEGGPGFALLEFTNHFWMGAGRITYEWPAIDFKSDRPGECEQDLANPNTYVCGNCTHEKGCVWGESSHVVRAIYFTEQDIGDVGW